MPSRMRPLHRDSPFVSVNQSRLFSLGNVSIPRAPGLRLDLRESHARRRIGNADQVLAGRALDLPAGKLRFALQRLIAVGTIEFEFIGAHSLYLYKRKRRRKGISKIFSILFT